MVDLGDFTAVMSEAEAEQANEPKTFTLHGETFAIQDEISAFVFLRFSRMAGEIDLSDENQVGAANMVVLFDLLTDVLEPEDMPRFEAILQKHHVKVGVIMRITAAILEANSGNPTESPSGSGGGPSGTSGRSSKRRSGRSATSKRAAKKTAVAKRSATVRGTKDRVLEAVADGQMAPPTAQDAEALNHALGTGSTG